MTGTDDSIEIGRGMAVMPLRHLLGLERTAMKGGMAQGTDSEKRGDNRHGEIEP